MHICEIFFGVLIFFVQKEIIFSKEFLEQKKWNWNDRIKIKTKRRWSWNWIGEEGYGGGEEEGKKRYQKVPFCSFFAQFNFFTFSTVIFSYISSFFLSLLHNSYFRITRYREDLAFFFFVFLMKICSTVVLKEYCSCLFLSVCVCVNRVNTCVYICVVSKNTNSMCIQTTTD